MKDLLFKTDEFIFSYRVAGILIHEGKILLQTAGNDPGYAFPGGHVAYGETHRQTLEREFQEETGLKIRVGDLKWVGEIFFPWGSKPCQQICLYYLVDALEPEKIQAMAETALDAAGDIKASVHFHWIDLEKIPELEIYPEDAKDLLFKLDEGVKKFIYRE
ncbi:MAG: NUDIX domain-containing protein [Clostridiales bacterium]|nr:NUDIX domain-containing protein [Clostridiales bacterium]